VLVTTADGTGQAGKNYTPGSMLLPFANGETSKTFTIPVLQDGMADGDKTVLLKLSDPSSGATLGGQDQAVLTIKDVPPAIPTGPTDVTAKVGVLQGKLRRKGKGRYRQQVTLTNLGGATLSGPVTLVLDGLSRKVKLRGQTKVMKDQKSLGSAALVIFPDGGQLAAGASKTVVLQFSAASARHIRYTPRVFAGPGVL
jgi:Calx-beta domain